MRKPPHKLQTSSGKVCCSSQFLTHHNSLLLFESSILTRFQDASAVLVCKHTIFVSASMRADGDLWITIRKCGDILFRSHLRQLTVQHWHENTSSAVDNGLTRHHESVSHAGWKASRGAIGAFVRFRMQYCPRTMTLLFALFRSLLKTSKG